MNLTPEELDWLEEENRIRPLHLRAVNCIFSNGIKLSPSNHLEDLNAYIVRIIELMDRTHIQYAVLGSGWARSIEDGQNHNEELDNLHQMMQFFANHAEKKGNNGH